MVADMNYRNQYPGLIHPHGFNYQTRFCLDPFPRFTYEIETVRLEKSVFMVHGENTTVVQYELETTGHDHQDIKLEVRPLIAFRDYHGTTHENTALDPHIETEPGQVSFKPYGDLPTLHLAHDIADIDPNGFWYRNFQYPVEQERGLDFAEDLFSPCALTFALNATKKISIIASTERYQAINADSYRQSEIERRSTVNKDADATNSLVSQLRTAADQFIVAREQGETVIAGYHWFADWGRDTMIALAGVTLVNGRFDVAKHVLTEF